MLIPSRKLNASLAAAIALGSLPGNAWAAGMPQLDFASPYLLWQIVWGALIFAVFYILLSRSALPKIETVLAHRRKRIEGDLDIARRARKDADHAIDELRKAKHDAATQAQANLDKVVQDARLAAEAQTKEMGRRLQADVAAAEERIAAAYRAASDGLPGIVNDTARVLAAKMLQPAGDNVEPVHEGAIAAAVGKYVARASR